MLLICVVFAAAILPGPSVDAAEPLRIGDDAPPIDLDHWVSTGDSRFSPVQDFEPGKVYVLAFHGSYCFSCSSTMPLFDKLQDQYIDHDVHLITISNEDEAAISDHRRILMERHSQDELIGDFSPRFSFTSDPDRSFYRDYMEAAGESKIPTTFIVGKTGKIEWIGYGTEMTDPLAQIVAGTWDREKFGKDYQLRQDSAQIVADALGAIEGKDLDESLAILADHLGATDNHYARMLIAETKVRMLVQASSQDPRLLSATKELFENTKNPTLASSHCWIFRQGIYRKKTFTSDVLQVAIDHGARAAKRIDPVLKSDLLQSVGVLTATTGDYSGAIAYANKALENLRVSSYRYTLVEDIEKWQAKLDSQQSTEKS